MKIPILTLSLLLTSAAASPALAGGLDMDFDGTAAGGAQAGASQAKLLPSLEAAFAAAGPAVPAPPMPVKAMSFDPGWPPYPQLDNPNDGGNNNTGSDGDSSGGNVLPPVSAEFLEKVLVASVCVGKAEYSSDKCMKKTGREAAFSLYVNMVARVFTKNAEEILTFHFPVPMTYLLFAQSLYQAEMHGIDMLKKKLVEDNKKLQPLAWESPSEKARKMRLMSENEKTIAKWKQDAILGAAQAANWKEIQARIFMFNGGPAYTQLGNALLGKEVFTGQANKLRAPQFPVAP